MALKDQVALGVSLPHRSPEPISPADIRSVAQRAEALGFRDLWVTENTLDHVFCFDPVAILTYAAAVTTTIRLGVSVVVLPAHHPAHVAHQWASLDYLSGGRAILGVGLGREHHYAQFEIPRERRVLRFSEGVELIRALWNEPRVDYRGQIYRLEGGTMAPKPVQEPSLPIWFGVGHPNAVRRAGALADGWMGSGGSTITAFRRIGADTARGLGEGRARSGDVPDLETAISWRSTTALKSLGRSSIVGSPRSITIPPAPTLPASTAPRNWSVSGSKSSWQWAPTTCC